MERQGTTRNERAAVKEFLQQYHTARRAARILENRHQALIHELKAPGRISVLHPVPPSHQTQGDGAVSVVFRVEEVEERIETQRGEMEKAVLRVMDLIDFLPHNSVERTVVELRHIDCKSWEQIAREVYMSRSTVFNHYNAALDALLDCPSARKLVEDYEAETRN